jgi:hypothetical protein
MSDADVPQMLLRFCVVPLDTLDQTRVLSGPVESVL